MSLWRSQTARQTESEQRDNLQGKTNRTDRQNTGHWMHSGRASWFAVVLRGNGTRFHRSMGALLAGEGLVDRVVTVNGVRGVNGASTSFPCLGKWPGVMQAGLGCGLYAMPNFDAIALETESGLFEYRPPEKVSRRGLEPPRLAAHTPQACASASSATGTGTHEV